MNAYDPQANPFVPDLSVNNDSFERLRARNSRRTFDEWVFIVLVILFLCAVLFCLCGLIFFRAKNIRIEGGSYYSAEEIISETGITAQDNLFFLDEEEIESRLTLRFPFLKSVRIRRILPTTLVLEITEDEPAYTADIRGEYFLLSTSLRVLRRGSTREEAIGGETDAALCAIQLPTVTYAVVGRPIGFIRESTYSYMLSFLETLGQSEYAERIGLIDAESKFRISIYLDDRRYKVIFGSAEEVTDKIAFFTNILKQKLEENSYAIIDVSDTDRAFVSIRDSFIEE